MSTASTQLVTGKKLQLDAQSAGSYGAPYGADKISIGPRATRARTSSTCGRPGRSSRGGPASAAAAAAAGPRRRLLPRRGGPSLRRRQGPPRRGTPPGRPGGAAEERSMRLSVAVTSDFSRFSFAMRARAWAGRARPAARGAPQGGAPSYFEEAAKTAAAAARTRAFLRRLLGLMSLPRGPLGAPARPASCGS